MDRTIEAAFQKAVEENLCNGTPDARLAFAVVCEAKDAEIAQLLEATHKSHDHANEEISDLEKQLAEAQAQIAMQAEALKLAKSGRKDGHYQWEVDAAIDNALSATYETVAAWRAKETEPLRREVAMLRAGYEDTFKDLEALNSSPVIGPSKAIGMVLRRMVKLLDDTQATALAYEQKVHVLEAQIAMQAEALTEVKTLLAASMHETRPYKEYVGAIAEINKILSATSETIAAFRAKETEPLRREVVMLQSLLLKLRSADSNTANYKWITESIANTQATALAYEREVENRGAVKALEDAASKLQGTGYDATLRNMAAELRASKGEVK